VECSKSQKGVWSFQIEVVYLNSDFSLVLRSREHALLSVPLQCFNHTLHTAFISPLFEALSNMRSTAGPLLLFYLTLHAAETSAQQCYNQQGVEDTGMVACNEDGGCCEPGDICWSNGFCKGSNNTSEFFFYVGCTDPGWNSPGCIPQCLDVATGTGVQVCPGNVDGAGRYCCLDYEASCDCNDPNLAVTIPSGSIVTTIPFDYFESASTSSTVSSSTSSATPTTASDEDSLADKSATGATTATSIAVASAVPQDSGDSEGLTTGAKAGIGVGAAAAAVSVIGALIFFMRRHSAKSRRDHAAEMEDKRQMQSGRDSDAKSPLPPYSDTAREPLFEAPEGTPIQYRNARAPVEAP
jgi:hypothetical protein